MDPRRREEGGECAAAHGPHGVGPAVHRPAVQALGGASRRKTRHGRRRVLWKELGLLLVCWGKGTPT